MAVVFARIELKGEPTDAIYVKLHAHMKAKHWYQYLPGHADTGMPHAMYQASFKNESPGLAKMAEALKATIESSVWTKALVLVIQEASWAQTGG
jgi:hypothetical protein